MQASLSRSEAWRLRRRTLRAMVALCRAQFEVSLLPMRSWRSSVGLKGSPGDDGIAEARRLARHVERAAARLPFRTRCLAQALALSRSLRAAGIGHEVVIAVRPPDLRDTQDALHAWVEVAKEKVLGDLPGPWNETIRLPR